MVHVIKAGSLTAKPATRAQAWDPDKLRSLPGSPEAILLPGHTPGNVSIFLPKAGAIAVGDSFVSGHPLSRKTGPQMLHRMYHTDPVAALAATHRLDDIKASVVLPGHGPALRIPLAEALAALRG
jgi:glyoxylase-like metal-dependent hydrolase (beta-lactamase superfamily II)